MQQPRFRYCPNCGGLLSFNPSTWVYSCTRQTTFCGLSFSTLLLACYYPPPGFRFSLPQLNRYRGLRAQC